MSCSSSRRLPRSRIPPWDGNETSLVAKDICGLLVWMCEIRNITSWAAEREWHKTNNLSDLTQYQLLLSSFAYNVTAAKKSCYNEDSQYNWHPETVLYFQILNLSPLATNLTADPYASFFTDKVAANSRQFSEPSTSCNLSSLTTFEKLLKTQLFTDRQCSGFWQC